MSCCNRTGGHGSCWCSKGLDKQQEKVYTISLTVEELQQLIEVSKGMLKALAAAGLQQDNYLQKVLDKLKKVV